MRVLDELATAIVQEFEMMWGCTTDSNNQPEQKVSSPSEVAVFDRVRPAEKKKFTPIIFSFSTDVSLEGIAKKSDKDHEVGPGSEDE